MGLTKVLRRGALVAVLSALATACLMGLGAQDVRAEVASLSLPLRVDARTSLREQFGYAPGYELNVPSFDPWNRPFIRSRTASQHATDHVHTWGGSDWLEFALVAAVRRDYRAFVATVNAGGYVSELVEFDRLGRAYTLLEIRLRDGSLKNVLLYSLDGCESWSTVTLPIDGHRTFYNGLDVGTMTMEHFTGHNLSGDPPLIALWHPVSRWPGLRASRNRLYVVRPTFDGDRLVLPPATLVTDRHLGILQAAGGASFAATAGATSFIVWTEVVPASAARSPTYVAALDRSTGQLTRPVLVGFASPANDDHDTPGICIDGRGYLHVVIGAHLRASPRAASGRSTQAPGRRRGLRCRQDPESPGPIGTAAADRLTPRSSACPTIPSCSCSGRNAPAWTASSTASPTRPSACRPDRRAKAGVPPGASSSAVTGQGYAIYHQKLAVDRLGRLYLSLNLCDPHVYPPARGTASLPPPHGPGLRRRRALVAFRDALQDYVAGAGAAYAGPETPGQETAPPAAD